MGCNLRIVTMTNWIPDLSGMDGPLYVKLANRIECDIEAGTLPAGAKLPPQRNLAFDIGVTLGTVTRAYSLVRERGLVSGEVGRGTYVRQADTQKPHAANAPSPPSELRMPGDFSESDAGVIRLDSSAGFGGTGGDVISRLFADAAGSMPSAAADYIRVIDPDWQKAGAQWIALSCGWRPQLPGIVPVHSAHGAITSVITAITNPGDKIACEALTYAGVPRAAHLLGRRSVSVAIDEQGLLPESFETVCAQQHPKLLFLTPGVHNPLTTTMPPDRRQAVIDIARRYNVALIEDSVYASLAGDPHTPLAALAPDITFHVCGLSKSVATSLRGGWIAAPPHLTPRLMAAHKMLSGGASYLLCELSARAVNSGLAAEARDTIRAEVSRRVAVLRNVFDGCDINIRDNTPFAWLKLPDPWLSGTFKNAAYEQKVRVDDEDEFKAGRGDSRFHGVRIAFGALVRDLPMLEKGARILRRLLDAGPDTYHSHG